jgi:2-oxo-hept-3-ene-1,7-dioate hydratase
LINKLAAVDAYLEPGRIVLAGSFTHPVSVAPGNVIHADYGPLGAIGVSFV